MLPSASCHCFSTSISINWCAVLVKVAVTVVLSLVTVPRTPLSTSYFASVASQITLFRLLSAAGVSTTRKRVPMGMPVISQLPPTGMVLVICGTLSALPKPIPPTLLKVTVNV